MFLEQTRRDNQNENSTSYAIYFLNGVNDGNFSGIALSQFGFVEEFPVFDCNDFQITTSFNLYNGCME